LEEQHRQSSSDRAALQQQLEDGATARLEREQDYQAEKAQCERDYQAEKEAMEQTRHQLSNELEGVRSEQVQTLRQLKARDTELLQARDAHDASEADAALHRTSSSALISELTAATTDLETERNATRGKLQLVEAALADAQGVASVATLAAEDATARLEAMQRETGERELADRCRDQELASLSDAVAAAEANSVANIARLDQELVCHFFFFFFFFFAFV
jgi:hypothetical protein